MENTPAFVYIKDENLHYTYMNKLMKSKLNLSDTDENISDKIKANEIFKSSTADDQEQKDLQILQTDKTQINFQYDFESDNKKVWLHDYKFPLKLPKEKTKIGGISFDITQLKEYERKLIDAKEKAEESDRLKTAFLNNMSHEIRTPMNAICGFAEQLNSENLSEEKKKQFLNIIQNSSQQLLSVINDILSISSIETQQEKVTISLVNINQKISELLSLYKERVEYKDLIISEHSGLPDAQSMVYTDEMKLTRILSNLLNNAVKFTQKGRIEFGYTLKDNALEFFVKDTGIGIKKEFSEKIFERFIQADQSIHTNYGGTGLGLSVSKAYTELLGGDIRVESEYGKGSDFYFTIPYKAASSKATEKKTEGPGSLKKTVTILIAEDEELNFEYLKELLDKENITILHSHNGKEAFETCKKDETIDLVLMDIKMPVMDGFTAANLIREIRPNLPIIAQTGYALDHEVEKFSTNFNDYLTKPIFEEQLTKKLSGYI
jgi:signal transduction histidine kinase